MNDNFEVPAQLILTRNGSELVRHSHRVTSLIIDGQLSARAEQDCLDWETRHKFRETLAHQAGAISENGGGTLAKLCSGRSRALIER